MLLSIIIVNWNSGRQLRDCLSTIQASTDQRCRHEIVIVDNGSTDDSLSGVEATGKAIRIIRNDANQGFAVACNRGAQVASGDYFLFLNPDTRLSADSISVPLSYLGQKADKDVGICGVQLVDEAGRISRSCARFPTFGNLIAQALGFNRLPWFRGSGLHMSDWDHANSQEVDHVSGAFFLMRREVFEQLNGFDQRFFLYLEDLDFSLRARQAGWRSVYLAEAQAFHAGGGTSRRIRATRLFYSLRSRLLYGFKHLSPAKAWLLLFTTLVLEPVSRLVFALIRASWSDAWHAFRGYGMLFRDLPAILRVAQGRA